MCSTLIICTAELVHKHAETIFCIQYVTTSFVPRLRRAEPGTFHHVRDVKGRREVDTT